MKQGADGATLLEGGSSYFEPALKVQVVEPVGPIDPEVGVLVLRRPGGSTIAFVSDRGEQPFIRNPVLREVGVNPGVPRVVEKNTPCLFTRSETATRTPGFSAAKILRFMASRSTGGCSIPVGSQSGQGAIHITALRVGIVARAP